MKSLSRFGLPVLLLMFCLFFTAKQAGALTVKDMRIGLHPDKTRVVMELSEMSKFRTFVLDNPWRLVVDLPDFAWHVGAISKPNASPVSGVRQGTLQPGISRVVIDLKHPVSIKNAFLIRKDGGKPDRLVIDFTKTTEAAYRQEKKKVHGLLDVDSQPAASAAPPFPPPAARRNVSGAATSGMAVPAHKPETAQTAPAPAPAPQSRPVIVLDAGHGGVDPGAIGANGIFEKHIALAMAKDLKQMLDSTGRYEVILTRDRDIYQRLHQRVEFARQQNADLFISLHADSIGSTNVRGASVYTLSRTASDKQTAQLAERENKADIIAGVDLSHEDEQVAKILIDLVTNDTKNQSTFFANTLVGSLDHNNIKTLEKPHRYAGFAVLKAPDIPSVLIEMGFMSNKSEAQLLASPEYRRKIAQALVYGIDAYFEKVGRNNRI